MSEAKVFKVKTRLSELAIGRGGISAGDAIDRAEAAVELTYESSIKRIDEILATLEAGYGPDGTSREVADYDRVYALASQIIDIAICLRESMLDEASRALCDLVDLSAELKVWDPQSVEIHIQVMRLLRTNGKEMPRPEREKLVQSLYQVTRKRVGDSEKVASEMAR